MRTASRALPWQSKSRQRSATRFNLTTPLQLAFQENTDMSAMLPRDMVSQALLRGRPTPPPSDSTSNSGATESRNHDGVPRHGRPSTAGDVYPVMPHPGALVFSSPSPVMLGLPTAPAPTGSTQR